MMKMVISNPIKNSEGKMDKVNRQNQKELVIVWHKIFMCVQAEYTQCGKVPIYTRVEH